MALPPQTRVGLLSLRPVRPFLPSELGLAAAAYVAALLVRIALVGVHAYTAEAAHFVLARDLWMTDPPVSGIDGTKAQWGWLFWQRPLFSLLMWPGAAVSFTGYRVLHVLVSSLVPALAVLLLLSLRLRPWLVAAAAAVLCLHPSLVTWNVLVLPDSLMLVLFLGAVLAAERGRPFASALLALAACWTKEVAVAGVASLFLMAMWRDADGTRARLFPLVLGRQATLYFGVLALAFMPLAYSLSLPWARFPGWDLGGDGRVVLERLFVAFWLLPLPLVALADAATRRLAVVSLAWTGFFLAYHFVLGKAVEIWYYVAPVTFAILAMACALSFLWRRRGSDASPWRRPGSSRAPSTRSLPVVPLGVSLLAFLLLATQILVPDSVGAKAAVITPFTGTGQWDLAQAMDYERGREQGLYDVMAKAPQAPQGAWLAIDTDWSFWAYPMGAHAGQVWAYFTENVPVERDAERLAHAIETANATILYKQDRPQNLAVRAAYADCIALDSDPYVLILGQACPGRAGRISTAKG